jgi:nucleoside-diphosphate-sugar epimerase
MRVFVTGSGGHIGTAVVAELVAAGHAVVGLVRSDASARLVSGLGAEVRQGDVNDVDLLHTAAQDADAVVHLAYDNAAAARGDLTSAADADLAVVRAVAEAIAGTGKTFIGIGIATTGDADRDRMLAANPRHAVAVEVAGFQDRGIRSMLMAVPPVTHSDRDRSGFIPIMIGIARDRKVSGYIGDGQNHWPAVHTLDLAVLFRLALEKAPAGTQLIGAAEPSIPVRGIAEAIGRHHAVPAESIPAEAAAEHFAPFVFAGLNIVMPNESTRQLLGWQPSHPTLIEDVDAGHYFGERD